ncbi:MAG: hypothetical protein ABJF23_08595 [Bryobacteraceae bacterium]
MPPLEAALQALETAQAQLMAAYPGDFARLETLGQIRAEAMKNLLQLTDHSAWSPDQLARLKRVHLGGILAVQRISAERQFLCEELSLLNQQSQVVSGYRNGSQPV